MSCILTNGVENLEKIQNLIDDKNIHTIVTRKDSKALEKLCQNKNVEYLIDRSPVSQVGILDLHKALMQMYFADFIIVDINSSNGKKILYQNNFGNKLIIL